jgi:hypothetical protein
MIRPVVTDPAAGRRCSKLRASCMTSGAIRLEMADRTMTGSDDPFRLGNHEPAKIATAAGLRAHEIT